VSERLAKGKSPEVVAQELSDHVLTPHPNEVDEVSTYTSSDSDVQSHGRMSVCMYVLGKRAHTHSIR